MYEFDFSTGLFRKCILYGSTNLSDAAAVAASKPSPVDADADAVEPSPVDADAVEPSDVVVDVAAAERAWLCFWILFFMF